MIHVTFPDGAMRPFEAGVSGFDIAKSISPSLAKRTVAMVLDGVVTDLSQAIAADARLEFISRDDPRALELIRHDCAHVLAEAVQELGPGTQVTIGPVIENGFYYDFIASTRSRRKIFRRSRRRCARSFCATLRSRARNGRANRPRIFSKRKARRSRSSWWI